MKRNRQPTISCNLEFSNWWSNKKVKFNVALSCKFDLRLLLFFSIYNRCRLYFSPLSSTCSFWQNNARSVTKIQVNIAKLVGLVVVRQVITEWNVVCSCFLWYTKLLFNGERKALTFQITFQWWKLPISVKINFFRGLIFSISIIGS